MFAFAPSIGRVVAVACLLASLTLATTNEAAVGRALPKPETTQPTLDDSLSNYEACRRSLVGERHGSAPAIMPDLVNRWIAAFGAQSPQARFLVPAPYAGPQGRLSVTLQQFLDGKREFAFLTRELLDGDRAAFRHAHDGKDPVAIPIAMGSFRHFGFVDTMVLVVHRDNPITGLTYKQIDGIYSASRLRGHAPVRTWGDLGLTQPQWRDRPMVALGGGRRGMEDSAKAVVIRQRILNVGGDTAEWNDRLPAMGDGDDNVSSWVVKSPGAIGITALSQVTAGLKVLAISEGDAGPWIAPTMQNVYRAEYPLIRTVDLLVAPSQNGQIDPLLGELARFMLSREGQSIVLQQGIYLPLRGRMLDLANQRLQYVHNVRGCVS